MFFRSITACADVTDDEIPNKHKLLTASALNVREYGITVSYLKTLLANKKDLGPWRRP